VSEPKIEADEAAAQFIRDHGGRFFIWASSAGIEHQAMQPPKPGLEFEQYAAQGFTLFVDRTIEQANAWRLVYHRFPRPHVRALWNGGAFSPSGLRTPSWEGDKPWE
jgi:hypothetical protein